VKALPGRLLHDQAATRAEGVDEEHGGRKKDAFYAERDAGEPRQHARREAPPPPGRQDVEPDAGCEHEPEDDDGAGEPRPADACRLHELAAPAEAHVERRDDDRAEVTIDPLHDHEIDVQQQRDREEEARDEVRHPRTERGVREASGEGDEEREREPLGDDEDLEVGELERPPRPANEEARLVEEREEPGDDERGQERSVATRAASRAPHGAHRGRATSGNAFVATPRSLPHAAAGSGANSPASRAVL